MPTGNRFDHRQHPSYLHLEHAKLAIAAGKNLLVEKPFTIAVSEAEELIDRAEKGSINHDLPEPAL